MGMHVGAPLCGAPGEGVSAPPVGPPLGFAGSRKAEKLDLGSTQEGNGAHTNTLRCSQPIHTQTHSCSSQSQLPGKGCAHRDPWSQLEIRVALGAATPGAD